MAVLHKPQGYRDSLFHFRCHCWSDGHMLLSTDSYGINTTFSRIRRKRYSDHYVRFILRTGGLPICISNLLLSFERTTEGDSQSLLSLFRCVRGIFDTDRSHPPSESGFAPPVGTFCLEGRSRGSTSFYGP
uniref:Orf130b n=1 Tax=Mutarda arvensis TaxID=2982281 RepID=A0A1D6WKN9_MUTAR|nr:orf130b [Sinapis arvensis]AJR33082.1 orf130b [Sinapis arvensis]